MEAALAGLGLVLAVFGLLGLFAGASAALVATHFAGAAALLGWAVLRRPQRLLELLGGSSGRIGGNVGVQTLSLIAIAGVVGFLSARNPRSWDWTEAKLHTLTTATLDVLRSVPQDPGVEILGFYVKGGERVTLGGEEDAKQLLDKYSAQTRNIRVAFFDPNARPDLAARHEITAERGVLLVCGGSCETAQAKVRVADVSESEITKAIRAVVSTKRKIYVLAGHGEAGLSSDKEDGFGLMKGALENENYEVAELVLANQPDVPGDAHAVLVLGPSHSLLDTELDALDRFLKRGGGVLVAADPLLISNLEARVRSWGIELGNDIVVEEQRTLFGPQLGVQPIVHNYGSHAITKGFGRDKLTLFHMARSLRAAEGATTAPIELVTTTDKSWAESDTRLFLEKRAVKKEEGADRMGPVALAMAAQVKGEGEGKEGRLVVAGDSDFTKNRYVSELYNADLMLNMVSWLVGQEQFATIERKLPRASTSTITPEQFAQFRFLSLFMLPELVVLGGVLVWWRRQS